jgi:hypothetical protein
VGLVKKSGCSDRDIRKRLNRVEDIADVEEHKKENIIVKLVGRHTRRDGLQMKERLDH